MDNVNQNSDSSSNGNINQLVSVHVFTSASNFVQYLEINNLKDGNFSVFKEVANADKVWKEQCCNKNAWLRILNETYVDCLSKNKENSSIWDLLKTHTKTSKLMFLNVDSKSNESKEIYTV